MAASEGRHPAAVVPLRVPAATSSPSPAPRLLYVGDNGETGVDLFAPDARGTAKPLGSLTIMGGGFVPIDIPKIDSPFLYSGDYTGASFITEYDLRDGLAPTPLRSIRPQDGGGQFTIGKDGRFFITGASSQVYVYAASADGGVVPQRVWNLPFPAETTAIATDDAGDIAVGYRREAGGGVLTYAPSTPRKLLGDLAGNATTLRYPFLLASDRQAAQIVVVDTPSSARGHELHLLRFASGANGNIAPLAKATVTVAAAMLSIGGIAVAGDGRTYLGLSVFPNGMQGYGIVRIFDARLHPIGELGPLRGVSSLALGPNPNGL